MCKGIQSHDLPQVRGQTKPFQCTRQAILFSFSELPFTGPLSGIISPYSNNAFLLEKILSFQFNFKMVCSFLHLKEIQTFWFSCNYLSEAFQMLYLMNGFAYTITLAIYY